VRGIKRKRRVARRLYKGLKQIRDGSIIKLFDKTPEPQRERDVICPHFYELKWAYGCPYDCSYCYLKGTFRFRLVDGRILPHFKDRGKIRRHLLEFLDVKSEPTLLNSGELCDSLMGEDLSEPFSEFIMPIIMGTRQRILFLTKGTNVEHFLEHPEWGDRAVLSWSVNTAPVAERWEALAPDVMKRIDAAEAVFKAGYEVRLRIDPMVPVDGWLNQYTCLLDEVFSRLFPERITLGSLRGLTSTRNNVKDRSWLKYLSEKSSWGLKPSHATRHAMYSMLMKYLRESYDYVNVGLCKETLRMWKALGLNWRNNKCNCIP
jgi:spore photoproduct lyase